MNFNEAVIEGAAPRALTDSKDKVLELKLWARPPRLLRKLNAEKMCAADFVKFKWCGTEVGENPAVPSRSAVRPTRAAIRFHRLPKLKARPPRF